MTQPDPQTPRVDGPGDWHRLSAWMMLEETPGRVPQFLGVVGLASLFLGIPGIVPIVVGALAAVVAAVPIWLATTYQVTDQHVRPQRRDRAQSSHRARPHPQRRDHRVTAEPRARPGNGDNQNRCRRVDRQRWCYTASAKQYATRCATISCPPEHPPPLAPPTPTAPVTAKPRTSLSPSPVSNPRWLRFAAFSNLGFTVAAAAHAIGARLACKSPGRTRKGRGRRICPATCRYLSQ